jgi:signal transduction histidine kinase
MERSQGAASHSSALRRIQSQWLSNLVHDLGSPLFAARGYARMVLEDRDGALTGTQRQYLTGVAENINRAVTLVRELNDFPGPEDLSLEQVSLATLLQKAVADASPLAGEKNIRFVVQIGKGLFLVGDSAKLASAMQAFLLAAVEFTGLYGIVDVDAIQEDERIVVRISATAGDAETPELGRACKVLRLHGGTASIRANPAEGFFLQLELPHVSEAEML